MIYTVTFSPSLDYTVTVGNFEAGTLNRTRGERIAPGGKGVNVSIMLHRLGVESTALGFSGGFIGDAIEKMLAEEGVTADMIRCAGNSRINVKIKSRAETEINGTGAVITPEGISELKRRLGALTEGDFLVLAGSVPASVTDRTYCELLAMAAEKGALCVVDTSGSRLKAALKYRPLLVKPNNYELGELYGVEIRGRSDTEKYAAKMQKEGARNVIVSLGGDGAFMLAEDGRRIYRSAPEGKAVDTVGAGDSLVAGFLAEYVSGGDTERAFLRGIATGSATAFSEGLASGQFADELFAGLIAGGGNR